MKLFGNRNKPLAGERPIEFSLAEIGRLQGYADERLRTADLGGREAAVLRYMQDMVAAQFIVRSEAGGRTLEATAFSDQRIRLAGMFEHSYTDESMGSTLVAYASFEQFYATTRAYLASLGALHSERIVDRSVVTMRKIVQGCERERREPSERERLAFINAAREGASACRVAGRDPGEMSAEIGREPALARFVLTQAAIEAVGRDHQRAVRLSGALARPPARRAQDRAPAPSPLRGALAALIGR